MVISQKMNVSKIDYRGSKSTAGTFNYGGKSKLNEKMFVVVKEPRLDGGCIKQKSKALVLRYSLRGLDKNHQVKILSKQINFTCARFYYTNGLTVIRKECDNSSVQLSPWFITGFSDGESCFYVGVQKNNNSKIGWTVELIYTITLHKKDKDILEEIKNYFCVGYITQHGKNTLQYRIKSIKDLGVIIEHFSKYPLITQKQGDFLLFKLAFDLVKAKEHLKIKGLNKIVGIRASLNTGINANLSFGGSFSWSSASGKTFSSRSNSAWSWMVCRVYKCGSLFSCKYKKICVSFMWVSSLM